MQQDLVALGNRVDRRGEIVRGETLQHHRCRGLQLDVIGYPDSLRRRDRDLLSVTARPTCPGDSVADGAELLVVPTNNAWYGPGEMSYQQLAMSRLRAHPNVPTIVTSVNSSWPLLDSSNFQPPRRAVRTP